MKKNVKKIIASLLAVIMFVFTSLLFYDSYYAFASDGTIKIIEKTNGIYEVDNSRSFLNKEAIVVKSIGENLYESVGGQHNFYSIGTLFYEMQKFEINQNDAIPSALRAETKTIVENFFANENGSEGLVLYTMGTPFVGYNNMLYMVDVASYLGSAHGEQELFSQTRWDELLNKTIEYVVLGAIGYISPVLVAVYSICGNNSFEVSDEVRLFAEMQEEKTVKLTYVQVDGAYAYGSHTESTFVRFTNSILPNLPLLPQFTDSVTFTRETQNYNSSDKHAFLNYIYGGHTERVTEHRYGGKTYGSKYI